ncbi:MAG: VWA domain-containing protein [Candidatus Acidiferrum sp.]
MLRQTPHRTQNRVLFIALLGAGLCAHSGKIVAQDKSQDANIKVQTSNVVVDVIVTDRHGKHVSGLTAADFTVYEDGVQQAITSFTTPGQANSESGTAPVSADKSIAPGATQPVHDLTASNNPHLLTVVLDLADNRMANTKSSSDAVLQYLDKSALSGDFVSIYYIDHSLHMALPFTNDLKQARETLKQLEQRKSIGGVTGSDRAATQEEINELHRQAHPETALGAVAGELTVASSGGGSGAPSPGNNLAGLIDRQIDAMRSYLSMENMFQARAVFAAMRAICLAYRDLPGRKNVVLFSEGFLYADDARKEMEAVADAANRSNVAIYVIDPEGIEVNPYGAGSRPTDTMAARIAEAGAPGANVGQHSGETKFDRIKSVGNISRGDQLEWLADTTGGFMVKRSNDLVPAFNKVLDDARDYYTLAYVPKKSEFDGKFHSIKVELAQRGNQLRYRKGYWAVPRGAALAMSPSAAQLIAGLQNGSLKSASTLEVQAQILLTPDGHYSAPVAVSVAGKKIPMDKIGEDLKATMTLILVARDSQGALTGVSQRAWNVQFPAKDRENFEKTVVTVRSQVALSELKPVSMEAILQLPGDTLARGGTMIELPDSANSVYQLSSLLLTDKAESATCSDATDPLCFVNVRLNQPANSRFPRSSRMIVFFGASNLQLDPQTKKPRLGAAFSIKSGKDTMKTPSAENIQLFPGPTADSALVLAEFDLKTLAPGPYTLQVTTSDFVRKTSLVGRGTFLVD